MQVDAELAKEKLARICQELVDKWDRDSLNGNTYALALSDGGDQVIELIRNTDLTDCQPIAADERKQFEEAAFAQYFRSTIKRNPEPPKGPFGCMDFISTADKTMDEFVAKNEDGSYKEESLNPAWWAWQARGIAPAPDELAAKAIAMLKTAQCPDPKCSDGWITNTGPDPQHDPCEWCHGRQMLLDERKSA